MCFFLINNSLSLLLISLKLGSYNPTYKGKGAFSFHVYISKRERHGLDARTGCKLQSCHVLKKWIKNIYMEIV